MNSFLESDPLIFFGAIYLLIGFTYAAVARLHTGPCKLYQWLLNTMIWPVVILLVILDLEI